MNDVRHQHRSLQRSLAAMAFAAILETFNLQSVVADQPVQTKSKSAVTSMNQPSGEKASNDQSDAGWRSRHVTGKWTAGTKAPAKAGTTAAKKTVGPAPTTKSATTSAASPAQRSPSLVFIAGKSAAEEHKPEPAATVPHDTESNPPAPVSTEHKSPHPAEHQVQSDNHAAPVAASPHVPSADDAQKAAHEANEESHLGTHGIEPHAPADRSGPTYFDSPPETMPGLSPEDSLDDQPVMSTTERLKQLLMENQRRNNGEAAVENEHPQHQPTPEAEGGFRSFSNVPSLEEDLNSSDPARRQRAQRILRIRQQILHLKSQAKKAESLKSEPSDHGNSATEGHSPADHATPQHPEVHGDKSQQHAPDEHGTEPHPDNSHQSDSHAGHDASKSPADHADAHMAHGDQDTAPSHDVDAHGADHHEDSTPDRSDAAHVDGHEVAGGHEGPEATEHRSEHGSSDATHDMVAIGEPIDRVGLANNLYALGEYPAAHDAYLAVEPEQLTPEQQFWVEYQIANCLRRVGESAAASNQFRKLAGQPEAGWISEQSAWWVDILEQIRQAEKALQEEDPASVPAAPPKKLPLSGISTEASHGGNKH